MRSSVLITFLVASLRLPSLSAWVRMSSSSMPAIEQLPTTTAVTILKSGGGPVQSLPCGYVSALPHWVRTDGGALDRIPADGGFVNPHNFDELWLPENMSPAPATRLALCALLKDGNLRCLFPGLDSFTVRPPDDDDDNDDDDAAAARASVWRNWGLASVPMASTFLDYAMVPLDQLKLSAFAAPATTGGGDNPPPASAWEPLYECLDLNEALSQILQVISDPPPALIENSGFQLLTVPLAETTIPPSTFADGSTIRCYLNDYPEPRRLLELKGGESTGGGFFEARVRHVASGAESEHLPEAYRPLFCVE